MYIGMMKASYSYAILYIVCDTQIIGRGNITWIRKKY